MRPFTFFIKGTGFGQILSKVVETIDYAVNYVMLRNPQRRNVAWRRTTM
jgi:hypothetical protein